MRTHRRFPWRRRAQQAEHDLHAAQERLRRTNDDWTPLAASLARIDREIDLNDWTATAKRIFSGRD